MGRGCMVWYGDGEGKGVVVVGVQRRADRGAWRRCGGRPALALRAPTIRLAASLTRPEEAACRHRRGVDVSGDHPGGQAGGGAGGRVDEVCGHSRARHQHPEPSTLTTQHPQHPAPRMQHPAIGTALSTQQSAPRSAPSNRHRAQHPAIGTALSPQRAQHSWPRQPLTGHQVPTPHAAGDGVHQE
jgi:hypothetical protein